MSWWENESYVDDAYIPADFHNLAWLNGPAVVEVFADGITQPGWGKGNDPGETPFVRNYTANKFHPSRVDLGKPFAFVMRSMKIVCIDIDGKNGGLEYVGRLGMLPYTLAEKSKSGNGYHLFYKTSEDAWDVNRGYEEFGDRIGLVQGVDFKGTGCVYHYPKQLWNTRVIAELPQHMKDRFHLKKATAEAEVDVIVKLLEGGDEDALMVMQSRLVDDLQKPIGQGRRNTTLFAIGNQMMLADVPGWVKLVSDRARKVGLDSAEIDKLIRNIIKYGAKTP